MTASFAAYQALPGVNWSSLKLYARSPAHYHYHLDHPSPTTPACLLGRAAHALILEGEAVYRDRYLVVPEGIDRRTKTGKEAWVLFEQEAQGRDILTLEQEQLVQGMAAAALAHAKAARVLQRCGQREVSLTWREEETSLDCKARVDALAEREGLVVDLKTCQDAGPEGFQRAAWRYQYHGQAAFYLAGMAAGGISARFLFLCVETAPPHGVALYLADDGFIEAGQAVVRQCLQRHAECQATGLWPGYGEAIHPLTLPPWARMAA